MSDTRLGYMPALDGLRAVAIVLVVVYHAVPEFRFGILGVDVFFVLSGFLITAIIAEQIQMGGFKRRWFYVRRAIRLAPALLVMVAVFLPIGLAVMKGQPTLLGAIAAIFYLTPLISSTMVPTIFQHTWTLGIEEWFYLIWPLVLAKFFRDRLTLRQAAGLIGVSALIGQAAMVVAPGFIVFRSSALMAGAALALWWLDGGRVPRPSMSVNAGMALLLPGAFGVAIASEVVPFWFGVAGATLVVGAIASGGEGLVSKVLTTRPFVAIGAISYEWYLLHAPMLKLGNELQGPVSYLVLVPLSLGLAFGLHRMLTPLQARLRQRLDDRPTRHDPRIAG